MTSVNCAKCGACSVVCPVFRNSGRESHTARGKLHLLDVLGKEEASREFVDIFSACLLCGACLNICCRSIDTVTAFVDARKHFSSFAGPHGYKKYLARKVLNVPKSLTGLRLLGNAGDTLLAGSLPKSSGLRVRLTIFANEPVTPLEEGREEEILGDEGHENNWFPGCVARYLYPKSLDAHRLLARQRGLPLGYDKNSCCCGLADWAAGDLATAQKKGKHNIALFEKKSGPVLVNCASCLVQLKRYPDLFADEREWQQRAARFAERLVDFGDFLHTKKSVHAVCTAEKKQLKVFYHDPCHMRNDKEINDYSRTLLQESGQVEMVELPDGPRCCGQGGLFHIAQPELSARIRDQLVTDVLALEPDVITTSCSGCLLQWKQGLAVAGSEVPVFPLAQLLLKVRGE